MISLLILIAGLVVYFVSTYDTLGLILAGIGGALLALQLLFALFVLAFGAKTIRDIDRDWPMSDHGPRLRRGSRSRL